MHPENSESAARVASVDGLAKMTTVAALVLGVGTIAAVVFSGFGGLAIFLGLLFLVFLIGSAAYVGAHRTAGAFSMEAEGARVVAQGVGRGGHGFLGAHVVVVTNKSVLSVSATPWGVGRIADAIPLSQIGNVEEGASSLRVDGARRTIALKACPPPQVDALLDEIRQRVDSTG